MAYSAQTFVAGEQPTTAKWNILWSNDASFNDGTGIGAVIAKTHLLTGGGIPSHLGFAQKTSQGDVIPNAYNTYLTINATSLNKEVRITYGGTIKDGSSGTGRTGHMRVQLDAATITGSDVIWGTISSGAYGNAMHNMISHTPTAAAHAWTFQVEADTASASLLDQAYILVEQMP